MDNIQNDVSGISSPVVSEDVKPQEVKPVVEVKPEPEKGSKTPEANLYAALEEERRLRKEAELKAKELELQTASNEYYSDEGKTLKKEIELVKNQLEKLEEERELERIKSQYPVLKDKSAEFEEFRKDFPRHKLDSIAKIFLAEKDLVSEIQPRKGLERPVAGPKAPPSTGMTSEDVASLRKTNFKKYMELLTSGKLNPDDIK